MKVVVGGGGETVQNSMNQPEFEIIVHIPDCMAAESFAVTVVFTVALEQPTTTTTTTTPPKKSFRGYESGQPILANLLAADAMERPKFKQKNEFPAATHRHIDTHSNTLTHTAEYPTPQNFNFTFPADKFPINIVEETRPDSEKNSSWR